MLGIFHSLGISDGNQFLVDSHSVVFANCVPPNYSIGVLVVGVFIDLFDDVVLGKEIGVIRHGLEFQVVPRRVLEKHGVLFPRLALEPQMGFNDELDAVRSDSFRQLLKLLDGFQRQSRVRDGDLVAIDRVVVIDAPVIVPGPVTHNLVSIKGIVLPLFGGPSLFAAQDSPVKVFGVIQRVDRKGVVEGIPGGGAGACLVLRCAAGGVANNRGRKEGRGHSLSSGSSGSRSKSRNANRHGRKGGGGEETKHDGSGGGN